MVIWILFPFEIFLFSKRKILQTIIILFRKWSNPSLFSAIVSTEVDGMPVEYQPRSIQSYSHYLKIIKW